MTPKPPRPRIHAPTVAVGREAQEILGYPTPHTHTHGPAANQPLPARPTTDIHHPASEPQRQEGRDRIVDSFTYHYAFILDLGFRKASLHSNREMTCGYHQVLGRTFPILIEFKSSFFKKFTVSRVDAEEWICRPFPISLALRARPGDRLQSQPLSAWGIRVSGWVGEPISTCVLL